MTLHQLFWKLTKEKFHPSWGYFGRSSKNIFNLLKIILHITSWTLILMLHIRQSIYLVLSNVLSTSFLMFHIHLMKLAQHCLCNSCKGKYTWYIWSNDTLILWNFMSAIFYEDIESCLLILPKQHTFVH